MKKRILALGAALAIVTGCARGGNDIAARSWDHVELHAVKFDQQFKVWHNHLDWWLLDYDEEDPELVY